MAGTMDKIKAKVDNVLHKDKHNDPTGPHSSHAANSADPRVDSDRIGTAGNTAGAGGVGAGQYGSTTHGTTHGTSGLGSNTTHGTTGLGSTHNDPTGPHSSHAANKADPRVDSDRYGTAGNTAGAGGVGAGQYSGNTHSSGLGSNTTHGTTHGDPSGPHSSKLANKLDPTVDTKSYGTADPTTGHYANTGSGLTGSHNTHGTTGSGLTGSHGTTGYNDPTGPHSSHAANKADPRVDSDRIGTAGNTAGAGGYGAGQYGSNTHNTGSGLTGTHGAHGTHGGTVGSGNSNTTAGPHNSDMLNKIDPRVDSDLDGSKTMGGNKTYQ